MIHMCFSVYLHFRFALWDLDLGLLLVAVITANILFTCLSGKSFYETLALQVNNLTV